MKKQNAAKTAPKEKLVVINIKISPAELAAIRGNAARYASGNLSMWLRIAGAHFSFGENSHFAQKVQPNQLKSKLQSKNQLNKLNTKLE